MARLNSISVSIGLAPMLLRNIPALLGRCGANLLHCRSPFYLCLEHVDNLGAYTASRPETGLLISSVLQRRELQKDLDDSLAGDMQRASSLLMRSISSVIASISVSVCFHSCHIRSSSQRR